jgi:hypothetical protein
LGGDIAVFFTVGSNVSTTDNVSNTTVSSGNGDTFMFGFAPRVGYLLRLSPLFTLWLRGGFSFYTGVFSTGANAMGVYDHLDADQFAIDLEPQIVLTPVPHFGITLGVDGDIPVVGRHSDTTFAPDGTSVEVSGSTSMAFVGVTLGLLGYF